MAIERQETKWFFIHTINKKGSLNWPQRTDRNSTPPVPCKNHSTTSVPTGQNDSICKPSIIQHNNGSKYFITVSCHRINVLRFGNKHFGIAPVFIFYKIDNYKINNWFYYGIYVAAGNHYFVTFYFNTLSLKKKKKGWILRDLSVTHSIYLNKSHWLTSNAILRGIKRQQTNGLQLSSYADFWTSNILEQYCSHKAFTLP